MCTMHIRKHIAFAPDVGPIDDTMRDNFNGKFASFWGSIQSNISNKVRFRELRFYDVPSAPGIDMGPPKKIYSYGTLGTSSTSALPPQVALSVTFKTAERRRWGRFYLPGLTTSGMDAQGRVALGIMGPIATAAAALCNRSGTGANLTVFSRLHWNDQDVQQVQVDDIYDVVRRRRFSVPLNRSVASP